MIPRKYLGWVILTALFLAGVIFIVLGLYLVRG